MYFRLPRDFQNGIIWAQIDLDAAAYNMQSIRHLVGTDKVVTAVVKANVYGHGAVEMAKVFLENGADRLAVACLSEAVELRCSGVTVPILVLGHTDGRQAREAVLYAIDVAVDSGMGRIGLSGLLL